MSGNSNRALELLQRAQRMSPRDPRGWLTAATVALAYFSDGRYEHAIAANRQALLQNPRYGASLRVLAASLRFDGKKDEATEVLQQLERIESQLSPLGIARSFVLHAPTRMGPAGGRSEASRNARLDGAWNGLGDT